MKDKSMVNLTRRERQIMDIIYQKGKATAAEVKSLLPEPPSYSTVRTILRVLEQKGHLKHKEEKLRYVYKPTISQEKVKHSALKHVMKTFFDDSTESVIAALLDLPSTQLTDEELDKLTRLIEQARKEDKL